MTTLNKNLNQCKQIIEEFSQSVEDKKNSLNEFRKHNRHWEKMSAKKILLLNEKVISKEWLMNEFLQLCENARQAEEVFQMSIKNMEESIRLLKSEMERIKESSNSI